MKFNAVALSLTTMIGLSTLSGCSIVAIGEEEFSCPGREKGVLCKGPREVYEMTNTQDEIIMGGIGDNGEFLDLSDEEINANKRSDKWLIANFDRLENEAIDDPDDDTMALYKAAVKAKMKSMNLPNGRSINPQTLYEPRSNNRQHPDSYDHASVVAKKGQLPYGTTSDIVSKQGEHGELSLFSTMPHDIAPEPLALLKPAEVMRILVAAYKDDSNDLHMPGYVYIDLQPRSWIIGEQANTTPQRIIPLDIRQKSQRQIIEEQRRGKGVTSLGVSQLPQMPSAEDSAGAFQANKADGNK